MFKFYADHFYRMVKRSRRSGPLIRSAVFLLIAVCVGSVYMETSKTFTYGDPISGTGGTSAGGTVVYNSNSSIPDFMYYPAAIAITPEDLMSREATGTDYETLKDSVVQTEKLTKSKKNAALNADGTLSYPASEYKFYQEVKNRQGTLSEGSLIFVSNCVETRALRKNGPNNAWAYKMSYLYIDGAVRNNEKLKNNLVFLDGTDGYPSKPDEGNFNKYKKTGVFYANLQNYVTKDAKGKVATKYESYGTKENPGADYTRLQKLNAKTLKKWVSDTTLTAQAVNVWSYIANVEESGSGYVCNLPERVSDFILSGYNYQVEKNSRLKSLTKSSLAASSSESWKLTGFTDNENGQLTGGWVNYFLDGYKYDEDGKLIDGETWATSNPNGWAFQNEYNLHYLDLMICAYAIAVKNNAPAASVWETAILNYAHECTGGTEEDSPEDDSCICATVVSICSGKISENANGIVYIADNDLLAKGYGVNASVARTSTSAAKTKISLSKPYSGFPNLGGYSYTSTSGSGANYSYNVKAKQDYTVGSYNAELYELYGSTSKLANEKPNPSKGAAGSNKTYQMVAGTTGSTKNATAIQSSAYYSYYNRIKSAVKNKYAGSTFTAFKSGYFYSKNVINAVVTELYFVNQKGADVTVKASTNVRANIQFLRQQATNQSILRYAKGANYGSSYIKGLSWREKVVSTDTVKPNTLPVLEVKKADGGYDPWTWNTYGGTYRSAKYATQRKNYFKTGSHVDVSLPSKEFTSKAKALDSSYTSTQEISLRLSISETEDTNFKKWLNDVVDGTTKMRIVIFRADSDNIYQLPSSLKSTGKNRINNPTQSKQLAWHMLRVNYKDNWVHTDKSYKKNPSGSGYGKSNAEDDALWNIAGVKSSSSSATKYSSLRFAALGEGKNPKSYGATLLTTGNDKKDQQYYTSSSAYKSAIEIGEKALLKYVNGKEPYIYEDIVDKKSKSFKMTYDSTRTVNYRAKVTIWGKSKTDGKLILKACS